MKNIQLYFRKGPVLMFGLMFPFFIGLAWAMGREISNEQLFIGISSLSVFFTSSAVSPVIFPWETREKGLERQITAPLDLTIILLGIVVSSSIYSLIISAIVIIPLIIALDIVFTSVIAIFGFIGGSILLSIIGSLIGLLVSAPSTDQLPDIMTLANLVKFPLIFISGIFIPLSQLSQSGLTLAWCSPISPYVDLVANSISEFSILSFGLQILILFAWCILLYGLSLFFHQRTFRKRFSQ